MEPIVTLSGDPLRASRKRSFSELCNEGLKSGRFGGRMRPKTRPDIKVSKILALFDFGTDWSTSESKE